MKLMGVDFGYRRIGIAVTDEGGYCVRGLEVIDRKKTPDYITELVSIIETEKPSELVFGIALNADDQETEMSLQARLCAEKIKNRTGLPIHYVDESFTSKKAAELMLHRKKKERKEKGLSDRIAACLILQSYLEDRT